MSPISVLNISPVGAYPTTAEYTEGGGIAIVTDLMFFTACLSMTGEGVAHPDKKTIAAPATNKRTTLILPFCETDHVVIPFYISRGWVLHHHSRFIWLFIMLV
jgi:hypothetical protein